MELVLTENRDLCEDLKGGEDEDCGEIFSKVEKLSSCGLVTLECRDRGSNSLLYWKLLDNLNSRIMFIL